MCVSLLITSKISPSTPMTNVVRLTGRMNERRPWETPNARATEPFLSDGSGKSKSCLSENCRGGYWPWVASVVLRVVAGGRDSYTDICGCGLRAVVGWYGMLPTLPRRLRRRLAEHPRLRRDAGGKDDARHGPGEALSPRCGCCGGARNASSSARNFGHAGSCSGSMWLGVSSGTSRLPGMSPAINRD
jgi:hypothetical protein